MFFDRLDPADVDPRLRVGHDDAVGWLEALLRRHLTLAGPPTARAACLTGPPGVGKSIVARAALQRLAQGFPEALFITVDVGACLGQRGVLEALVSELARALDPRRKAGGPTPALLAAAQVLRTLTRFEQVPLRVVHEQLRPFQPGLDPAVTPGFFDALRLAFGLAFDLSDKQIKRLTGVARFDPMGLADGLVALVEDLRAAGLDAVVLLDDLDGLRDAGGRRGPDRRALEALLALRAAPVGWVITLRTAATAVIPREISYIRALRLLDPPALRAVLDARLAEERAALRDRLLEPERAPVLDRLAAMAPTPRAFLRWVKFLFEEGRLSTAALAEGVAFFLESEYSALDAQVLRAVAWCFPTPDGDASEAALLAACDNDRFVFGQLLDHRVVRPRDHWHPATTYQLDPELVCLHPVAWGEGETT